MMDRGETKGLLSYQLLDPLAEKRRLQSPAVLNIRDLYFLIYLKIPIPEVIHLH